MKKINFDLLNSPLAGTNLIEASAGTGKTYTIIGLFLGPVVGGAMIRFMTAIGQGLLAFEEAAASGWSVLLAVVLGLGMTWLAVFFPARRAAQVVPLAALRQPEAEGLTGIPRMRTTLGLLIIAMLMVHLIIAPPGEWVYFPLDANLSQCRRMAKQVR